MANLKEIRSRIRSVKSTQQTTRAMKMVSAAKLRRAQDAAQQLRPYAEKLSELLGNVAPALRETENLDLPYLKVRPVEKVLYVLLTSNRGLAGAFNNGLAKVVEEHIHAHHADLHLAGNLALLCLGRKGFEYFENRGYRTVHGANQDVFADLTFDTVAAQAQWAMERFADGSFDKVYLAYNGFVNVMSQDRRVDAFLPVQLSAAEKPAGNNAILEPDAVKLGESLVPKILKTAVFSAVLDSHAGEHGARMIAMDNATENAQELLDHLKLTYNKARQAAITTEILEIVSGAEALANG